MSFTPYRDTQELVSSLGTNITLEGVIIVLDEHFNNVKALDALK